jgi:Zn finger protein HypA/HybF involved in hydrogenase expression
VNVAPLARTLDQELAALVRGASFECLVCGEFVMHLNGVIACPECRSLLAEGAAIPDVTIPEIELPSGVQAG